MCIEITLYHCSIVLGTVGIRTSVVLIVLSIIFISSFNAVYAVPPTVNVVDQGSTVNIIGIDANDGMGSVLVQGEPVMSSGIQFCFNPANQLVVNHPKANLPATVTVENCSSPPEQTIVCVGSDLSQTAGDCNDPVDTAATELVEKMMLAITVPPEEDCGVQSLFEGFPLKEAAFSFSAKCPGGVFNKDLLPIQIKYTPDLDPNGVTTAVLAPPVQTVDIFYPNFIDEFNTKTVKVEILYGTTGNTPKIINIKPSGQTEDTCFQDTVSSSTDTNTNIVTLVENWICHPNPDDETVTVDIGGVDFIAIQVQTFSFDRHAVGGEIISLDTTMVLLAGTQTTAAWLIPVIVSGIGIGIVIVRKF